MNSNSSSCALRRIWPGNAKRRKSAQRSKLFRIVEVHADHSPPPWLGSSAFPLEGCEKRGTRRRARVGENEAIFREVNETVASVAIARQIPGPIEFLCECADEFCAESVALFREEYEQLRAVPERFAVAPEHVLAEVERVVEKHRVYWVVEKFGVAAEIAEETGPALSRVRPVNAYGRRAGCPSGIDPERTLSAT